MSLYSIVHLIEQSFEYMIKHLIEQSIGYSIESLVKHTVEQSIGYSIESLVKHTVEQSIEYSIKHPVEQSIKHSIDQSIEHCKLKDSIKFNALDADSLARIAGGRVFYKTCYSVTIIDVAMCVILMFGWQATFLAKLHDQFAMQSCIQGTQ
jgi:hypothetical protein